MEIENQIKDLNAQRLSAFEAGKEILDRAVADKRGMTEEETVSYGRTQDEMKRCETQRDQLIVSEEHRAEMEGLNEEFRRAFAPSQIDEARQKEAAAINEFFRAPHGSGNKKLELSIGDAGLWTDLWRQGLRGSELMKELRVLTGDTGSSSGGSLSIPTTTSSEIYAYMTASVAVRRMGARIISTASGEAMKFPKVAAASHGIATQVANQDTAFAGTDPVLAVMTLDAYDAGQLIKVASNYVEDSGANVLSFVTSELGRAIGELTAQWYVTGTGSSQPQGLMTAVTGTGAGTLITGGTVVTGGTTLAQAAITPEKLIDLISTVNDSYQGKAWLTSQSTAGTVRKIRDGAGGTTGAFIWQPSPTVGLIGGQPDLLLGYPVFTDPNVAAIGSNARIIGFGDPSRYFIRDSGGLSLDRSDDFAFDKNQISFRVHLRTDGDLIDDVAWNILKMAVA